MAHELPDVGSTSAMPTEEGDRYSSESQSDDFSDTGPAASRSSSTSTKERFQRPRPALVSWFTWASASMVGGLVMAFVLVPVLRPDPAVSPPPPWIATPEEVPQFAPDAGMGEAALANAQNVPKAVLPKLLSFGRPMPSKPFPGQRRPPCEARIEREIHGACWLGPIEDQRPPCGERMFDYEGKCFLASYDQSPQPTSEPP